MAMPVTLQDACRSGKASAARRQLQRIRCSYDEACLQNVLKSCYSSASPQAPNTQECRQPNDLPVFHLAFLNGQAEILKVFLDYLANQTLYELMMTKGPDGATLFHSVCCSDNHGLVSTLVERLKQMDSEIIQNMCLTKHVQHSQHQCLVYYGTAMHAAVTSQRPCTSVINLLSGLEGSHLQSVLLARDYNGQTPLHLACLSGHTDVVRSILRYADLKQIGHKLLTLKDSKNNTPFHLAVHGNSMHVVNLLLGKSRSSKQMYEMVTARNTNNDTPLHLAAGKCQSYLVKTTLQRLDIDDLHSLLLVITKNPQVTNGTYIVSGSNYIQSYGTMSHSFPEEKSRIEDILIDKMKLLDRNTLYEILTADYRMSGTILHLGLQEGHTRVLELLQPLELEEKCQILLTPDCDGQTLLHLTCATGATDATKLLLEYFSRPSFRECFRLRNCSSDIPLHIAIREGYGDIALTLIKQCEHFNIADVIENIWDSDKAIIFNLAISKQLVSVLRALLPYCQKVMRNEHVNSCLNTTLHLAALSGSTSIMKLLTEFLRDNKKLFKPCMTSRNTDSKTPLDIAVSEKFVDGVDEIFKYASPEDIDFLFMFEERNKYRKILLLDAIISSSCEDDNNIVKGKYYSSSLSCFYRCLILVDDNWKTTTCVACRESHSSQLMGVLLKYLRKLSSVQLKRLMLESRSERGTLLHFALRRGHTCLLQLLDSLDDKANLQSVLQTQDSDCRTLFQLACYRGQVDVVRTILEVEKMDKTLARSMLDDLDIDWVIALQLAVRGRCINIMTISWNYVEEDVLTGLKLNQEDAEFIVHHALFEGHPKVLSSVLKHFNSNTMKTTLMIKQKGKNAPFHKAIRNGDAESVHLVVEMLQRDDLHEVMMVEDATFGSALNLALYRGHATIAKELLDQFEDNSDEVYKLLTTRDSDGDVTLHLAICECDVTMVRTLLAKLHSIHKLYQYCVLQDSGGKTSLSLAVNEGHTDMVGALFEVFRDNTLVHLLMARDSNGDTPLHVAITSDNNGAFDILVESLSNDELFELLMLKNGKNDTVLHTAIREGDSNVVEPLLTMFSNNQLHDLLTTEGQNNLTLFQAAARVNHVFLVYTLLRLQETIKPYELIELL